MTIRLLLSLHSIKWLFQDSKVALKIATFNGPVHLGEKTSEGSAAMGQG